MTGWTAEPALRPDNIVGFIASIFERRGAESYLGEEITVSQHMLQAAHLAERAGCPDDMIAAALLHDIGHCAGVFPEDATDRGIDNRHEEVGAHVLERFFPRVVTDCVRWHVAAKRYLCATDPDYRDRLSDASIHSLRLQGGPMSEREAADFAKQPNLDSILQVRMWDEGAKDPTAEAPDFSHYVPLLRNLVDAHTSGG